MRWFDQVSSVASCAYNATLKGDSGWLALKAVAEPDKLFTDRFAEVSIRGLRVLIEHARGFGLLANLLVSLAL